MGPIGGSTAGARLDQNHAGLSRVDGAERPREGPIRELGDLADDLDAGRSCADHDKGQPALPFGLGRRHLGGLERAEDAAAQLERVVDGLHARREGLEMIVAEVGLLRASGQDQGVERRHPLPVHQLGGDGLVGQIDPDDLAEQHLRVLLFAQDQPGGGRDLTDGQDARRDLVQQRLEQMMGRHRDQCDVDIGALEVLGREQAAEARTDDDDAMTPRGDAGDAHVRDLSRQASGSQRTPGEYSTVTGAWSDQRSAYAAARSTRAAVARAARPFVAS